MAMEHAGKINVLKNTHMTHIHMTHATHTCHTHMTHTHDTCHTHNTQITREEYLLITVVDIGRIY